MEHYFKQKGKEYIIYAGDEVVEASYKKIDAGIYDLLNCSSLTSGTNFGVKPILQKQELIKFTSGAVGEIIENVGRFFSKKTVATYKELKVGHKLGVLLYGPQGTGKSCTATLFMNEMVTQYDAVCLDITDLRINFVVWAVNIIRKYQNNPIVLFADEFEEFFPDDEAGFLTFLDGNESVDNIVLVACTNFIDKIPDRIKFRRSRIKYLYEIKSFPVEVYKEYIKTKLPSVADGIIAEFAFKAEENGLTMDEVKHAVIDHVLEGISIDDSIKEVKKYLKVNERS